MKKSIKKIETYFQSTENHGSIDLIKLDEDSSAVSSKLIQDIYGALDFLNDGIKNKNLIVSTRHNTIYVAKSKLKQLGELLGSEEDDQQNRELDLKLLRQANNENHRLREEMGKGVTVEAIGLKLYELERIVYDWWQSLGFTYSKHHITCGSTGSSLHCEFSVSIDRNINCTERETKPITAKAKRRAKIKSLEKELQILTNQSENYVLESPNNRKWLIQKIHERFPTMKIYEWQSYAIYGSDEFQINKINAHISLKDIQ